MNKEKIKSDIRIEEGLRQKKYRCPAGKLSICYGHNMEASPLSSEFQEELDENGCLSKESCERLLDLDVERVAKQLDEFEWFRGLSDVRQDVLIDMVFNIGIGGFHKFVHLIAALSEGDYTEAAIQMLKSDWATEVGDRARKLSLKMNNDM
jgi:lysozyme